MAPAPPPLYSLVLESWPIEEQLRLEEALYRGTEVNWFLWNQGAPPAMVLGMSNRLDQLVDVESYLQDPCPIIRRCSGGGAVVVDEETLFTTWIIRHSSFPGGALDGHALLRWVGRQLSPLGIEVQAQDFTWNNRKVGGNAQCIGKAGGYHHTSFLWRYRPEHMNKLRLPTLQPAYREQRPHHLFCASLEEALDGASSLLRGILEALEKEWPVCPCTVSDLLPHLRPIVRRSTYRVWVDLEQLAKTRQFVGATEEELLCPFTAEHLVGLAHL